MLCKQCWGFYITDVRPPVEQTCKKTESEAVDVKVDKHIIM